MQSVCYILVANIYAGIGKHFRVHLLGWVGIFPCYLQKVVGINISAVYAACMQRKFILVTSLHFAGSSYKINDPTNVFGETAVFACFVLYIRCFFRSGACVCLGIANNIVIITE